MPKIIHFVRKRYEHGLLPGEFKVAPKAEHDWYLQQRHYLSWSVDRLILSESARNLIIRSVTIANVTIVEELAAAHFIGVKAPAGEDEERRIADLRSCFRYQDHTKEELQRAIVLLRPTHHLLDWPKIPGTQVLRMKFYNPTDEPVTLSGMIAGEYLYELLDA